MTQKFMTQAFSCSSSFYKTRNISDDEAIHFTQVWFNSKVGAYPFTTLEPNLGEMYGFIIADIPGLIEGAATGKGLGHKFLRHIRRTKILVHLVSIENEDPINVYNIIRSELSHFDKELLNKKEIVVLTKTDLLEDKTKLDKIVSDFEKIIPSVTTLTIYDDFQIKSFGH